MALVIRIEQNYKLISEKSLVSLAVSQYDTDTVGFVHIDLNNESILKENISQQESPLAWGYLPTDKQFRPIPGSSLMRDVIVDRIGQLGLRQPTHNLLANRPELHNIGLM
jgi:hypothetical protein